MNLSILYKKLTNKKHTIGYKFILSLLVGFVGIISFCSATEVEDLIQKVCLDSSSSDCNELVSVTDLSNSWTTIVDFGSNRYQGKTICIRLYDFSFTSPVSDIFLGWISDINNPYAPIQYSNNFFSENYVCMASNRYLRAKVNAGASPISFKIEAFVLNDLLSTALPIMTSMECQSEYNLIPIEEVDINYCISNNLCPATDFSGNWSSLFINNIQYPGTPTIKFTIPEEIERDQNTDEEETNIDVIGYGYDQDKMQQMVNTQYYKPTAEEMSGLMKKVADFLPLVAVALLITRIRRVLKKVFKL